MSDSNTSDFLVLGGGLAGSVIASRLADAHPSATVTVLEAGNDETSNPLTIYPLASFGAHFSPLDWAYFTVPQKHLDGKPRYAAAGKALGGSSAINYGTWTRGPKADYDAWGQLVGDARWSYDGLLPHFRKTEHHFGGGDKPQHGFGGPITTASVTSSSAARVYPLREPVREAWQAIGAKQVDDANAGYPVGFSELVENWRDGRRQVSSAAYGLTGKPNVRVVTGVLVRRVILELVSGEKTAVGAEAADGAVYRARKEVIVTCGAYRTPQVLLLSGIGPAAELSRHRITPEVDLPVGLNFHDHLSLNQFWKLAHPEQGLSTGTPLWTNAAYQLGLPCDWIAYSSATAAPLEEALKRDEQDDVLPTDAKELGWARAVVADGRAHVETIVVYAPAGARIQGADVPLDGSHIATAVLCMHPTSRGSITLASADPRDPPVIDPNYYATENDRAILRSGVRQALNLVAALKMKDGAAVVTAETLPPGGQALAPGASDDEIDERVRGFAQTFYHAGGGACLGRVVDAECRVKGVRRLRVADASVMPAPISAHYQVATYAIAEQAAEMISKAH
jgi:choline dehydrogenase-like flavoprotein